MKLKILETTELALCRLSADRGWVVKERFEILAVVGMFHFFKYIVRAGTATDGASIPRFFWRLIGPPLTGKYVEAAVVHDAAYAGKLGVQETGVQLVGQLTRAQADRILRLLCAAYGVAWWRRWIIWAAVRLFGRRHYLRPSR